MFLNSLELRFAPVNWPYLGNNLSFAVFNDLGNVFDTPKHLVEGLGRLHETGLADCRDKAPVTKSSSPCDLNYVGVAIGAGIHYKTPIGPVRLDLGYNLNPATFPVRNATGPGVPPSIPPHIETLRRFNIFFSIGQTF